jgi:hypothetical protein
MQGRDWDSKGIKGQVIANSTADGDFERINGREKIVSLFGGRASVL